VDQPQARKEKKVNDDEGNTQVQHIANAEITVLRQALQLALAEAVQQGRISQREAFVVGARLAITDDTWQTLQEVAHVLEVKRERVRQIQNRALWKLRKSPAFAAAFRTYLERIPLPKARHQKPPWLYEHTPVSKKDTPFWPYQGKKQARGLTMSMHRHQEGKRYSEKQSPT
ncbi:MAG: hypothetical protein J2P37_30845, partial [Ktedonobacteraceae bacterium]|nr:hypothetical protein [Ktedonobacteraceae bacterium]